MKMTRAMPMPFQTSTSATDRRARSGSPSHCGPSMPICSRAMLTRPSDGCSRTANVIPTATVLTRTGKKITDRSRLRESDARGQERRQEQPEDDLEPARDDGVDDRVAQAARQRRLTEEQDEVVEADELGVEQRPAGQAVVERQDRRDDEDDPEDDRGGEVEPVRVRAEHGGSARTCHLVERGALERQGRRCRSRARPRSRPATPSPAGRAAAPPSPRPGRTARPPPRRCTEPVPTATVICSSAGPLTGERNSSAGAPRSASR